MKEQKQSNAQLTDIELWALVLSMFILVNFNFIIIIMMCLPTTTADCEKGFSLMAIKLNTAEEGNFDAATFITPW